MLEAMHYKASSMFFVAKSGISLIKPLVPAKRTLLLKAFLLLLITQP